ncbi:MAG: MFS transporter [Marinobacterium sp.]|nr:MFS transporter [Marinobacterium sp.]
MFSVLKNNTYRHLFLAQVIALLGTGLATVALGLKAFELAGENAGTVLGTALAIKMLAYIGIAPMASAITGLLPRRVLLVTLDLVRAGIALLLPFVTEIWQIYLLIFLLQSASAAFTPTFQATIPDVLPDEKDYTKALSLSRLAYDLESILSPLLAGALLAIISAPHLFNGTALGFTASALLVLSVTLPVPQPGSCQRSFIERTTLGTRIFLATPRLRGLLALNLVVASASAMVIVNTVVLVQDHFGLSPQATAWAFAAFGFGSIVIALSMTKLSEHLSNRQLMQAGAMLVIAGLVAGLIISNYSWLLSVWFILGVALALIQTPAGQLIRRSSHAQDRPALFAAQFALSHGCWLITYPLVGWLGANLSWPLTFSLMATLAILALLTSRRLWPKDDQDELWHSHEGLAEDDPHWQEGGHQHGHNHSHHFIIDEKHPVWPR